MVRSRFTAASIGLPGSVGIQVCNDDDDENDDNDKDDDGDGDGGGDGDLFPSQ